MHLTWFESDFRRNLNFGRPAPNLHESHLLFTIGCFYQPSHSISCLSGHLYPAQLELHAKDLRCPAHRRHSDHPLAQEANYPHETKLLDRMSSLKPRAQTSRLRLASDISKERMRVSKKLGSETCKRFDYGVVTSLLRVRLSLAFFGSSTDVSFF